MSASLNQLRSNTKFKPIIILIALLVLTVASYLIFSKPSTERLIKNLTVLLREEKFEQLYQEAEDSVRLNVTKEKFVQRMKIVVAKLKAIDEDLNFQRDDEAERMMKASRDDSIQISAFQRLGKDNKAVLVSFYWTNEGNFRDMWVLPEAGTSEEYQVYGVSYQHLYIGNRMVE
ncbi:MAG TPA: hypothetical protein VF723_14395 [Pyrinomonadaceae bacterium]|jgi:hypothetical protein